MLLDCAQINKNGNAIKENCETSKTAIHKLVKIVCSATVSYIF